MMKLLGPELEPLSKSTPKKLAVLLHGLGANGDDLFSLTQFFAPIFPDTHFLSPHAPFKHPLVYGGYQWFSIDSWDEMHLYNGIVKASSILQNYLETNLARFSLDYKDLVLIGFSQGAMMSLYLAPRLKKPITGVVSFSGALIRPELMAKESKSKCPILLVHGNDDQVVPKAELDKAKKSLTELGFSIESYLDYNASHNITEQGIIQAINFLKVHMNNQSI